MNRQEIYNEINTKLLTLLKQGTLPWRKSWKTGIPTNLKSKRPYQGINYISLSMLNYASPYYVTYKQCEEMGGRIKPGQKGNIIIFWKIVEVPTNDESEDVRSVPYIRYTYAFNITQTTLYRDEIIKPARDHSDIISGITKDVMIRHNTMKCFYSPGEDVIYIPNVNMFDSEKEYYSALFHEAIHATGNKNRLNRFSTIDKVKEELVAEIGSSYLCSIVGIAPSTIDNQAAYIASWIKRAATDKTLFTSAAILAQHAVDYIMKCEPNHIA